MQETGFESLSFAATAAVWSVTVATIAALGVAGAYWTWAWFAPRPEPNTQVAMPTVARLDAAYRLFGDVPVNRSASVPGGITVKLLGLVAASGNEPGYAVLQLDAKRAVAVRQGGEIEPGTRVVEVNTDHIVLDRGGMRETLAWPKQGKVVATPPKPARN
jgi:general secretion pathway protein C